MLESFEPLGESRVYPTLAEVLEQNKCNSRAAAAIDNYFSKKAQYLVNDVHLGRLNFN